MPTGSPTAGDTLGFPTLASNYVVTNDLAGSGPIYSMISVDGMAAGKPSFTGGWNTNELAITSLAGATLTNGSFNIVGRSTFRGQSVTNIDGGATLSSGSSAHSMYLWDQSVVNVRNGGAINLSGTNSFVGIDDGATLNVNSGGSAHFTNALIGNDSTAGTRGMNVAGAGANMRVDFQALIHTSGFHPPAGVASISVTDGARFSTGIMTINQSPTAIGLSADTDINVDNGTFEVSNAVGFQNSYFMSGASQGVGKTTINLSNGGQFRVSDTDGAGQAFAVFSNSYRTDTQITIGGANSSGINSTMQIDGSMYVAPAIRNSTDSTQTLASINVNSGGRLTVRDTSVFAGDDSYAAVLDVRPGAIADLGDAAIFSGGNAPASPTGGAGTTSVIAQGEIRAGCFEYLADSSVVSGRGGMTSILVSGSTAKLLADGVDNPATPQIDSGFFAPSRGDGTPGSDLAIDGVVSCTFESLVEANEAFFAGDLQSGHFSLDVTGSNARLDAGGLFAVNDRGLADSVVTINVINGGTLVATTFSNGTAGSIRVNTAPGSGIATLTVGSGGTIQSNGAIQIGGELNVISPGIYQRVAGTHASVGGDGTIVAGGSLYLGAGSSLVSNRFDVNGAFIDGEWFVGNGGPEKRIRTGSLLVWSSGSLTFSNALSAISPSLMVSTNVSIEAGATFNLKNNALLIRPDPSAPDPTTLAALKQFLANGRTGVGTGGISSSLADNSTALGYARVAQSGTFLGEPVVAGDLLVRYTLKGDADLNGAVDFDDLLTLAQNYDASGEWYTGDFNFDGQVNFDDLLTVAQNYGSSLLAVGTSPDRFVADLLLARGLIPEPATGMILAGSVAAFRRRR